MAADVDETTLRGDIWLYQLTKVMNQVSEWQRDTQIFPVDPW
ncbi:hypothetical protein ATKI12_2600 [Kitasatospora sp. Ki12]